MKIFFILLTIIFSNIAHAENLNFKKLVDLKDPWGSTFIDENNICRQQVIDYYFEKGSFPTEEDVANIPKCKLCDNCLGEKRDDIRDISEETKHIINKETLKKFPDGAVISNSARGDMIDDEAMVEALKNGKIYSLGIDVYNGEPDIHPEYLALPNVFVLPHLGSATKKTRTAMADLAVNNLKDYFQTGKCKNQVN